MSQLKLSLVLEAIDRGSANLRHFADAVRKPMLSARQGAAMLGGTLDKVSGSLSGLAAAIGGGIVVRDIIKDSDALALMGINAEASRERIEKLRGTLIDTAVRGRVSLDEITAGLTAMRAGGMSLDAAEESLATLAATIQRLGGGQGEAIGETFAVLSKFSKLKGPDELLRGMAILREQMKGVPGGLQDFMDAAAPLMSAYASQGHTGLGSLRDIGGLYATIRPGMANPRQTRSAVEELLAKIGDKDTAFRLESLGVDVFGHTMAEKRAGYETGTRLPIGEILRQLLRRYQSKGMTPVLDDVLGPNLRRALKVPLGEVKETGSSPTLDLKLAAGGDTLKFLNEVTAASRSFGATLAGLKSGLYEVGEQILATPLRWLADMIADNTRAASIFTAVLGGFSIAAIAWSWLKWVSPLLMSFRMALVVAAGAVGDFFIAIRAGYGVMAAFNLVLAANPIGAVLAAIGLLAAAAALIYEKWEPISAFFDSLWEKIGRVTKVAIVGPAASEPGMGFDIDPLGNPIMRRRSPVLHGGASPDERDERRGRRPLIFGGGSPDERDERRKAEVGGQITVRFDNAPPGMRVSSVRSDNPAVNYTLDVGYAVGTP